MTKFSYAIASPAAMAADSDELTADKVGEIDAPTAGEALAALGRRHDLDGKWVHIKAVPPHFILYVASQVEPAMQDIPTAAGARTHALELLGEGTPGVMILDEAQELGRLGRYTVYERHTEGPVCFLGTPYANRVDAINHLRRLSREAEARK